MIAERQPLLTLAPHQREQAAIFSYPPEAELTVPTITRRDVPQLLEPFAHLKLTQPALGKNIAVLAIHNSTHLRAQNGTEPAPETPEVISASAALYSHELIKMLETVNGIPNPQLNVHELVTTGVKGITASLRTYIPETGISFQDHTQAQIEAAREQQIQAKRSQYLPTPSTNGQGQGLGQDQEQDQGQGQLTETPEIEETNEPLDLMDLYTKEITAPLLTFQQEIELAKKIETAKAKNRPKDVAEAKKALTEANLSLVIYFAKDFQNQGLTLLELIQEGNIGLFHKAVEKYDYRRGYRFSTYAGWWIRQGIRRAIDNQGRAIRTPVHALESLRDHTGLYIQLTQDLGREPTPKEMADFCEVPVAHIETMERIRNTAKLERLDRLVGEDQDIPLDAILLDPEAEEKIVDNSHRVDLQKILSEAMRLAQLTDRQRDAVEIRQGVGEEDVDERQFKEVADILNKSSSAKPIKRERARQLHEEGLLKLQAPEVLEYLTATAQEYLEFLKPID